MSVIKRNMPEWAGNQRTICPHCGTKNDLRPNPTCDKCGKPVYIKTFKIKKYDFPDLMNGDITGDLKDGIGEY